MSSPSTDEPRRGDFSLSDAQRLVGKRVRIVFDAVDSTPDLPDVGPLTARIVAMEAAQGAAGPRLVGRVESPPELLGLTAIAEIRYEEESLASALQGRPVTVNAFLEDSAKKALAGGIATMFVERG
jgi:hypothetical protein